MVRLKEAGADKMNFGMLFQFHYGTIKRVGGLRCTCFCVYFNSTMVRLKVTEAYNWGSLTAYFNSTMVRLKVHNYPYPKDN